MVKKIKRTARRTSATHANKRSSALHDRRFAGESAAYRKARNNLLKSEIELRRQIERVARLRRALPIGGVVPEDYLFDESDPRTQTVRRVRLSELFGDKPTLVAYSFMFGPAMATACPSCTSILDGLDGQVQHVMQQTGLVVIAKSPIARIRDFARERGWTRLRLVSSADNSYNRDYWGEGTDGSQWPVLNVFVRRDGKIHHFFNTEMLLAQADPGQNARHVDMIWPLWNVLDFTPEGRGTTWQPKLKYDS